MDGAPGVACTHPVRIRATGRGPRQAIKPNGQGFPRRKDDGERIAARKGPRPCGLGCGDRVAPATPGGRRGLVANARGDGRTTVLIHTRKKITLMAKHLKVVERRRGHQATPSRTADEGLRHAPLRARRDDARASALAPTRARSRFASGAGAFTPSMAQMRDIDEDERQREDRLAVARKTMLTSLPTIVRRGAEASKSAESIDDDAARMQLIRALDQWVRQAQALADAGPR